MTKTNGYRRILLGGLLAILSHPAGAANWNNSFGATLTVGYDDNFRLAPEDGVETAFTDLGLVAGSRRETETSSIDLGIGANAVSYSDSSIDDETRYDLSLLSEKRGERSTGSLDIGYQSELITTSELLDTGLVDEDGNRDTASVRPGASYRVDERNTVFGSFAFEDVSYDTDSLIDYKENSLSLSWQYQLDETSNLTGGTQSTVYDPDEGDETDTNTVYVGYEWRTETSTIYNVRVGYTEVESSGETDEGGTFIFGIDHTVDEFNRFNLSASNTYDPSGLGEVRETARLAIIWTIAISQESRLTFSVDGLSTDERDYYAITTRYNYQLSQTVALATSYRYRQQEVDDLGKADSSTLLFSLSYSTI